MELIHEKFGTLRMTEQDGMFWFRAKDVGNALEIVNYRDAVATMLDEDEKGVGIFDTPGGPQEMLMVNESGLYALVMRSNKPRAREFRKWVTAEVLPTLRRTGRYELKGKAARQAERANEKAYRELLSEIKRHVDATDCDVVARRMRLNPGKVWLVYMGRVRNLSIMRELYEYALKNRLSRELFCTPRGVDAALRVLRGEADVSILYER
jgi:prophage antirepressor-like protein